MSALHEALKTLGPYDFTSAPLDNLHSLLSEAFTNGQLLVDSVPIPIPAPADTPVSPESGRWRSNTTSSLASSASEISLSSARSAPPTADVEALQREWKAVKLGVKENPLGMSVYKLGGRDGRGSWFARRSVHSGLGFAKWKRGLEREFPETMKVRGGPGEGNIRGIGGERRVEYRSVEGVGKLEVYLLSAQFPGPTTPRDFVTLVLTSDQALAKSQEEEEAPRHFMVISKPCLHPDTPARDGFIRGQYESVEFIREIPISKRPKKSASTTDFVAKEHTRNRSSTLGREAILRNATSNHSVSAGDSGTTTQGNGTAAELDLASSGGRPRGKTISFDTSRGLDAKGEDMDVPREDLDSECNPIEWIMITRSDPGGSVPRFMVERGTPGGIVADASKFLDWACSKDIEDFESDNEETNTNGANGDNQDAKSLKRPHRHDTDLHNYQTNGHLAGLEEETPSPNIQYPEQSSNDNLSGIAVGAIGGAGAFPSQNLKQEQAQPNGLSRRSSIYSTSSISSIGSFASALENRDDDDDDSPTSGASLKSTTSLQALSPQAKELQKLEAKKLKLTSKLHTTLEKELAKKSSSDDTKSKDEAIRKVEQRHEREVKKQEERYLREVEKLKAKQEKEEQKARDRQRKAAEKDEKTRLVRELDEARTEASELRKERDILRSQIGDLQAENTMLAVRVGKLGGVGEGLPREVREEVGRGGRLRASSLRGLQRPGSLRGSESSKENLVPMNS